jgi:hypothetical protein
MPSQETIYNLKTMELFKYRGKRSGNKTRMQRSIEDVTSKQHVPIKIPTINTTNRPTDSSFAASIQVSIPKHM